MFLLDSHFLRINSLIDADSLRKRSSGGRVRREGFGLPTGPPSPAETPQLCRHLLVPGSHPGPRPQLVPAGCCRMPLWDVAGIRQVQLLPGLIYSA